jgi:hypothetical protein
MTRSATNITWLAGLGLIFVLLAAIGGAGCDARDASASPHSITIDKAALIERGNYLVRTSGCNDCHTPLKMGPNGPEPDMSRMLSGHPENVKITAPAPSPRGEWENGMVGAATATAYSGPWGVSFTANLTPDRNTGLGIWTEEMFVQAIRTGRHYGVSRPILPPMPWSVYRNMTDDDLKAIYAYLRTIPPVINHVPDPLPPSVSSTH